MPKPKKSPKPIDDLIHTIRGQKVILDTDLAELYGVPTKVLNQAVKRNQERFLQDFMFQLSNSEWSSLRSQIAASSLEPNKGKGLTSNWSQSVTSSSKNRGASYRPHAFTEHGAIMASTILSSPEAVRMSQYIVRAFIKQREFLMANADLLKRLAEIDAKLLNHDDVLKLIIQELQPLLNPPPEPPAKELGFHVKEEPPAYGVVSVKKTKALKRKKITISKKKA